MLIDNSLHNDSQINEAWDQSGKVSIIHMS